MERAEQAGLGVAIVGHVALFGLLSVGFLATPNPLELKQQPIEVTLSDEVGLESAAPTPSVAEPAPRLAEVEGPVEPAQPAKPVAQPRPTPRAVPPAPSPKPAPRVEPRRPAPAADARQRRRPDRRPGVPTGALAGIVDGLTDRPSQSRATMPPAKVAGAAVKASLAAELIRQLRPHWTAPTGPDADQLRTTIRVRLAKDGSLAGEPTLLRQTGVTDSNRAQAQLHAERAIKAVKLAAPFKLPGDYYDAWKTISPVFDKRLG